MIVIRTRAIEQLNDKNMLNNWLIKASTLFDVFYLIDPGGNGKYVQLQCFL